MEENLKQALPFIIGFFIHGESALFLWLLFSANRPAYWIWISGFAVLASNLSFLFYYLIGFFSFRLVGRFHAMERIIKRVPDAKLNVQSPPVLLLLRFLVGVRNPIAVYLGIRKFSPSKFVIYNFLGSLLWIVVWFGLFYFVRNEIYGLLIRYRNILYGGYGVFLILWIGISVATSVLFSRRRSTV